MSKWGRLFALCLGALCSTIGMAQGGDQVQHVRHVLLISIDGMHALDYVNCTQGVEISDAVLCQGSNIRAVRIAAIYGINALRAVHVVQRVHSVNADEKNVANVVNLIATLGHADGRAQRTDTKSK